MSKVKAVFFDLAGTTIADDGLVEKAFVNNFKHHNIHVRAKDVQPLMGVKKIEAIKIILKKNDIDYTNYFLEQMHQGFEQEMIDIYTNENVEPLPNVINTFDYLMQQNIAFGFNTGFSQKVTKALLKKIGWNESNYAKAVVCSDEVEQGRPHPYMIQKLMKLLNIEHAANCIKIGDTEVDIMEGQNAKCLYSIGITTGAYTRNELLPFNPNYIIDDMLELVNIIENLNQ